MIFGKKIKLVYTLGQVRFILALVLICLFSVSLGSETYKITTYYPAAPFASYEQLRALTRIRAGDNGTVQLGNNIFADIDYGTVATPEISTSAGDIIFAPGNEKVTFGATVFNFCRWVGYGVRQTNETQVHTPNAYCPARWTAVAMSSNSLDNGNAIKYVSDSSIERGWMLCCRFNTINN